MPRKKIEEATAEVKETIRTAGRKAKAKLEETAEKASDAAAAAEIEVKKTTRTAGRKAKAKVEEAAAQVAEKASDAAAAAEIEVKKATTRAKRTAQEGQEMAAAAVEEVKKPARKARAAKLEIVVQSMMGGAITIDEIAAKVPSDAISAYVKVEENRIYWVDKNGETGSMEIWS